jgi:hypothetical protein
VRLRLIIADHGLKRWPWEFAYLDLLGGPDGERGFLALDPRLSLVRHEPLPLPHPVVGRAEADLTDLRLVLAAALPEGQRALRLDREIEVVTKAVQDLTVEGVRLTAAPVLRDVTYEELDQALRGPGATFVFHFAGHGVSTTRADWYNRGAAREEGALLLVDDKTSRRERRLAADDLGRLLQRAGVRLAVLGACQSGARSERHPWDGVAGALAARAIPAIVAMQYEVLDEQAIAFSQTFYGALASGLSLDEAVAVGRLAMLQTTRGGPDEPINVEWGVPVLYSRLPDGRLFPERMVRASEAAQAFRTVVSQVVEGAQRGELIGITASRVKTGFRVEQRVTVLAGEAVGGRVGAVGPEAQVEITQVFGETKDGSRAVGLEVDEL